MSSLPASPPAHDQDAQPYSSAAALRAAHSELLRREPAERRSPEFLAEVATFIARGRISGKFIDNDNERRACQGMLDYWTTVLYQGDGDEPLDSTLDLFDPALAPELPDEPSPYVGLKAFDEKNNERFFGRRERINDLVKLLRSERFVAVVGPSGSGKSSLVLGGLLPALRAGAVLHSDRWRFFAPLVPGSAPLANLARALRPSQAKAEDWNKRLPHGMLSDPLYLAKVIGALTPEPALLVVDQFEELFTLGAPLPVVNAFAANLLGLVRSPGPRHSVVITMRSDFEPKIALLPELKPLFERAQVRVTPMGAPELREAIEEPARQVGLKIEPRVVDALINDILGYDAALPLLQFTLLRLWELRDHNRVTWETYQQTGGGKEALERSAEAFYKNLPPELQETMRRVLLRMVRPRAGLEFTSKRIRRAELYKGGEADYRIDEVVKNMLRARLLRQTDAGTPDEQLEVAHEALVRNWRRLVDWLEQERERLREQQRLAAAADSWKTLGEDPNALLRGALLDEALRLPIDELGPAEREFLRAGLLARFAEQRAQRDAEQAREAARQHEVAQARALTEAERERATEAERRQEEERARAEAERLRASEKERAARRLRRAALALAAVLVLAIIAGLYAYSNYLEAERQQVVAKAAQATSRADADKAGTAGAVAVAARQTAENLADARATAEANAKVAQARAQAARQTAEAAAVAARAAQLQAQHQADANATEVVIRTTAVAQARAAADEALAAKTLAEQQAISLSTAQAEAENARQTSQALQSIAEDKRDQANALALRNKASQERNRARRLQLMIAALQLSSEPSISQDFHTALQLNHLPVRTNALNVRMAWNPAGDRIVIASGNEIELWNAPRESAGLRDKQPLPKQSSILTSLAWSPNGASFAVGGADGSVQIWDAASPALRAQLSGHTRAVTGLAWRPDSQQIATSSTDGTLRIWNIASRSANVVVSKQNEIVTWAAWHPDGSQFVSSAGNTIYIRDANTGAVRKEINGHTSAINTIAWSPDGSRVLSASDDGTARIWDVASGVASQTFQVGSPVNSAFWSPDGQRIATASDDAIVRIWVAGDASTPLLVLPSTASAPISAALWNPDGWRLAVAATDGTLREFWPKNDAISAEQLLNIGRQLLAAQNVPTLAPAEVDRELEKGPTAVPAATITLTPSAIPTSTATPTPTFGLR